MGHHELVTKVQDPYVIVVTSDPRQRTTLVATPDLAAETVALLSLRTPSVGAYWMVRPDFPVPGEFGGRYVDDAPGIGQRERCAHLFKLFPGERVQAASYLRAQCGTVIPVRELEMFSVGTGTPCNACQIAAFYHQADTAPAHPTAFVMEPLPRRVPMAALAAALRR